MSFVSTILCAASMVVPDLAQSPGGEWSTLFSRGGNERFMSLGIAVADAGDVNGDGFVDYLVGSLEREGGQLDVGSAHVLSGADGSVVHRFLGSAGGDRFGEAVAGAGDLDGDGFGDVIVGANGADVGLRSDTGSVFVLSGLLGTELFRFNGSQSEQYFGRSVDGAGDVNGDGYPDLIVGSHREDYQGLVDAGGATVFSGRDGSELHQIDGAAAGDFLGCSVAGAGDVNGDGFDDFIVGAYGTEIGLRTDTGSAFVISGATGTQLWRFNGAQNDQLFGWSVDGAGDVDGDGYADIVIGSLKEDFQGAIDAGGVSVYSGYDGRLLHHFDGEVENDFFGSSVAGAGDVDGDGLDDLIVGACCTDVGGQDAGSVYVFSGASGELLERIDGASAFDTLGSAVSGAGDIDLDGNADVLIGVPGDSHSGLFLSGSYRCLGFDPFLDLSAPSLSASSGVPLSVSVDFPVSEAGRGYALLASGAGTGPSVFAGISIPLEQDSIFALMIGPNLPPIFVDNIGTLDAAGNATAVVRSDPLLAGVVGSTLHLAVASFDPITLSGRLSSVARALEIRP